MCRLCDWHAAYGRTSGKQARCVGHFGNRCRRCADVAVYAMRSTTAKCWASRSIPAIQSATSLGSLGAAWTPAGDRLCRDRFDRKRHGDRDQPRHRRSARVAPGIHHIRPAPHRRTLMFGFEIHAKHHPIRFAFVIGVLVPKPVRHFFEPRVPGRSFEAFPPRETPRPIH